MDLISFSFIRLILTKVDYFSFSRFYLNFNFWFNLVFPFCSKKIVLARRTVVVRALIPL